MKCYKCGAEIEQDDLYCMVCGASVKTIAVLVEEGRKGDQQALGELYNRTYEKVYFTLKGLCRDEDTVLDLLQDSYLKAYKNLESLKEPGNFQAWIKMIAINTAKNWFKKKTPVPFSQVTDDEDEEFNPIETIVDAYPDHQPEDVMDQKETSRLLNEIMDSLSDEQRIAVTLYYYEEWDIKSIAKHAGCSEGTIKSRLNYGRKKIEEAVFALEKKGTKLYGLAPIPFFLWLLRGQEAQAAPAAAVIGNVLADLGKGTAAETAGSAAAQAGAHGTVRTAANAGSHAGAHSAAETAANTAAHAAASAAAKGGAAAVTKGLAAKLVAVVIGGAVIGGGAAVGTLTYVEKTEEHKQQQQAEAVMARQEQNEEEGTWEIRDDLPDNLGESSDEEWEIRDDLLDNLGESTEEIPTEETPTEEKPPEPGDGVDMIENTPEPEITSEPEAVPEPEPTSEPEAAPEPEITSEPEAAPEPEPTSEPEAVPEPTAPPAPSESENKIARKAYKRVLKEVRLFLGSEARSSEWRMNTDALAEKYPHVNFTTLAEGNNSCAPMKYDLFYCYYDIDHNGVDELLLSYCLDGDNEAMDIYKFDGENAKSIQNEGPELGYRCGNQIFTDGTIFEYGSGGASAGSASFYKFTENGHSVTETEHTFVYSVEYASRYGYTDYITQEQLREILSRYEKVTDFQWKKLEPISEENKNSADENVTPADVTAEYEAVMAALLKPYAWYLAWQNDDFVFDDYAKSSMIVLAAKDGYSNFIGMTYEEVKNVCKEPMERYFGPDAEFMLAEDVGYSVRYMYQNVEGQVKYKYGDSLDFPFGVVDNIQKIGRDTYQMKYDFYIFNGWEHDPPEEYSALVASISQGLSSPADKSYTITLKDTESGFIITDMKLS